MNNPFDYQPSAEAIDAHRHLLDRIESLRDSVDPDDVALCRELDKGKMIGILLADDANGRRHTLYAFSGQFGENGFHHPMFVEPVFDYLRPDGYFKTKEAEISQLTRDIQNLEQHDLAKAIRDLDCQRQILDAEMSQFKDFCRRSKAERDAMRGAGNLDDNQAAALIAQSQFEKAELNRLKKSNAAALKPAADHVDRLSRLLDEMKQLRRAMSEELQKWLFDNFKVLDSLGRSRSLSDIFASTPLKVPPSGAGECCAPKLLQAAYLRSLRPVEIAEYWFGMPKDGEVRISGCHYPACRGKCLPVLTWMLGGLDIYPPLSADRNSTTFIEPEIIFECQWFCVVNKPAGMLSVPGKGPALSVEQWLKTKYGPQCDVKMAHRLDQATSGLIIAAFDPATFKTLQRLFATRQIRKTYEAILEGDYRLKGIPQSGRISIPLSPDWLDRPRQRVDLEEGKEAVTDYEFISSADGYSRVIFRPMTGRTHQLRLHAASTLGLGMPIVGDPLYGLRTPGNHTRLHLHASRLEFTFPADGRPYEFSSPAPFARISD